MHDVSDKAKDLSFKATDRREPVGHLKEILHLLLMLPPYRRLLLR